MTAYTKTTPGAPSTGFYALNDSVTDSNNVVWTCVQGGFAPGQAVAGLVSGAQFTAEPTSLVNATGVGTVAANSGTVTGVHYGQANGIRTTVLTLAALAQAVVNGTEYQGTKVFTFPEGRILVLGAITNLAQTTTSAILSTLNGSSTGALGLGTATASNVALTSTMVDLGPTTAFTSSATISVAGTAVQSVLAAAAAFDGHTTAKDVYVNTAYATTTDVDADATQTLSGTITLTWISLGDY